MKNSVIVIGLALCFLAVGFLRGSAQTSEPQFLVTWRAQSYVPPWFGGKVLPGANSPITVSFDLVSQGKILDLTGQTIYWYANNGLLEGASGKQTATFSAPAFAPNLVNLRIQMPNYKGNFLIKEIKIPVVAPEVVIETPYPAGSFFSPSFSARGVPYFFNVASPLNLNFSWSVNGEPAQNAENPDKLDVTLNADAPSGSTIEIGLYVKNPDDEFNAASANVDLIYAK
ncbi:MAG: hypothetical protein Q7R94_01650 [bacterium]|nr:hypothetical protein [bacterium]